MSHFSHLRRAQRAVAVGAAVGAAVVGAGAPATRAMSPALRPAPLYGVTVDELRNLSETVRALAALPVRAVTRVYLDAHLPLAYYEPRVARIHAVSGVMAELLDSSDERMTSTAALRGRVISYLSGLGHSVDIWEVGNEVNGAWAGAPTAVEAKLRVAYDLVHAAGRATALTLYANDFGPNHCGDGHAELTPLQFARRYIPAAVRLGLSYVLLSYYPTQCGGLEPTASQLRAHLVRLHALFPRSRLGFGELGLPRPTTKLTLTRAEQIMRWGYGLNPNLGYYAGGYFWWYAAEDALRPSGPLSAQLSNALKLEQRALGG